MTPSEYEYDVFVSHAVEDKLEIADELVEKLKQSGIKVWYSGHELRVGYPVDELIKEGLNNSRHGIVILSHNFFEKNWTKKELSALWVRENNNCRILPVWHKITEQQIKEYDTDSARNYGIPTHKGIDFVVRKLVQSILENSGGNSIKIISEKSAVNQNTKPKRFLYGFISLALVSITIWFFLIRDVPSNELVLSTVEKRIEAFQKQIMNDHILEINKKDGIAATSQQVIEYYDQYESIKSHYRNEYYFNTGYADFNFKKNVEPALGVDLEPLTPSNNYGFTYPNIFIIDHLSNEQTMDVKCIFINSQSVEFKVFEKQKTEDEKYIVEVNYENNIRYLSVDFIYSKRSDWIKRKETTFQGFLPKETYRFEKEGDMWIFAGLD